MDIEKLRPQAFAFGVLYRIITYVEPNPNPSANTAAMYPFKAYTMLINNLNRKNPKDWNKKIGKLLAEFSSRIEMDDWIELFNTPMPLELQGQFLAGYQIGPEKSLITRQRKLNKLTQTQLAEKIGATQKDISRWESGTVKPNVDTLNKLSDALNCSIDDLIAREPKKDLGGQKHD